MRHTRDSAPAQANARRGTRGKASEIVGVGVRVLNALMKARRSLPLREVAAASGLSRSQAHRYLLGFVNGGVVRQDPATGLYDIGSWTVRLGLAALSRTPAIGLATRALDGLVERTGYAGLLTAWGEFGPTVIRVIDGSRPVRTSIGLGAVLPLLSTSSGQAFLAYLPAATTAELVRQERRLGPLPPGLDPRTIRAAVKARGFAEAAGALMPGLSTISAPVLDARGHAAAVIGLMAQSPASLAHDKAVVTALLNAAANVTRELAGLKTPQRPRR